MRASSTASLHAAVVALDQSLGANLPVETGTQVAEEFFSLATVVGESGRLARSLTDPARTPQDKQKLAAQLFEGKVSQPVAVALGRLAAGRWSSDKDLTVACHMLASHVLLKTAQDTGRLEEVERNVFAVGQLLHHNRRLRSVLSDNSAADANSRVELFTKLVGDQVDPLALRLMQDAVRNSKAGRLQSKLRSISDAAAALRNRGMATVTTATPLSAEQIERVRAALSRTRGQDMVINTVVDPDVVGGIKIRYADSVVDGSIANLLNETRRQLAG